MRSLQSYYESWIDDPTPQKADLLLGRAAFSVHRRFGKSPWMERAQQTIHDVLYDSAEDGTMLVVRVQSARDYPRSLTYSLQRIRRDQYIVNEDASVAAESLYVSESTHSTLSAYKFQSANAASQWHAHIDADRAQRTADIIVYRSLEDRRNVLMQAYRWDPTLPF